MDRFIVALDQSGDSVCKTLSLYGIEYNLNNKYKMINDFKKRIIMSDCLNNDKIFGVILSKDMIDEKIESLNIIDYLKNKGIKLFVKVDAGLSDEINGVRVMNNIPNLEYIIDEVLKKGSYGTKMRSLILKDDRKGIRKVLNQQFFLAKKIYLSGLIPIIEPEVSIYSKDKEKCEIILKEELINIISKYDIKFILKLTLPSKDGFYDDLLNNKNVIKLSFLSGGYSKDEAIDKLSKNKGIACFSRALLEGITYDLSEKEFNSVLSKNIDQIWRKNCE